MFNRTIVAVAIIMTLVTTAANAADTITSTTSSTVIDKTPPTASAPSIVVNNNDVCKSAYSAGVQTQILGIASGITVTDENCERLKLARSLYGMGMKVAAVSTLCQDARVFDAMLMAGTPCPYKGKIGTDALAAWNENPNDVPSGSQIDRIKKKDSREDQRRLSQDKRGSVDDYSDDDSHEFETEVDPLHVLGILVGVAGLFFGIPIIL
jgi:hypothetical protein